jgi:hypothetical protein
MMGGVMAGVLLGPTIFGRVLPAQYEHGFVGGVLQRQARDALITRRRADEQVALQAQLHPDEIEQMKSRHAREQRDIDEAWQSAKWDHQAPLRGFALTGAALTLFGSGLFAVRRGDAQQGLIAPLSIGVWAAAVPGALAYAAMTWWWEYSPQQAAAVAAAVAIGPWVLTPIDQDAADQAELGGARMIQTAGRIASLIALGVFAWAMWSRSNSAADLLWVAPLLALPIGWITLNRVPGLFPNLKGISDLFSLLLIPALAACVAVRIELIEHFAFWPIVIVLLLSDEGRWIGAFLGAMLPGGRRGLRTLRLVMGSMAAGPTQLTVTALAVHTWTIPDQLLLPLLLGAVLIETTAPARRKMAQQLIQTEQELDDMPPSP